MQHLVRNLTWYFHDRVRLVATRSLISHRFMSPHHLNPLDAVVVHKYLRAKRSVGTQWGTFKMVRLRPCHSITLLPSPSNYRTLSCHLLPPGTPALAQGDEPIWEPVERLAREAKRLRLGADEFVAIQHGQTETF